MNHLHRFIVTHNTGQHIFVSFNVIAVSCRFFDADFKYVIGFVVSLPVSGVFGIYYFTI